MSGRAPALGGEPNRRRERRVLFRADASPRIGSGHVVRCLALAAELERRGTPTVFATRDGPGSLSDLMAAGGSSVIALHAHPEGEVAEIAACTPGPEAGRYPALVMDDYELGDDWLRRSRGLARRRFVIDDLANRQLPCEVLVNPSLAVSADEYADVTQPGTELLLGTRYALLRPAFAAARAAGPRPAGAVTRILVSMGGGDPWGASVRAVAAARSAVAEARVDVVLGALHAGPREFGPGVEVHEAIDAAAMANLLASSDMVIGAGGTSSWERCCLGRPSIVVRVAANQDANVDRLAAIGAAIDAGPVDALDTERLAGLIRGLAANTAARRAMIDTAWKLVDGRGVERLANHIEGVRLRRATMKDVRLLWEWANDPGTRAASLHPDSIPFADHERWLRDRLADRSCLLLIGENGAGRLGQVRFDRRDEGVEISISVAPEHRGTVGGLLLASALRRFRTWSSDPEVYARVKVDNVPSRRIFERAGFHLAAERYGVLTFRASLAPRGAASPEGVRA